MINHKNLESYINDEAKEAMTFRVLAELTNSAKEKMRLNDFADDGTRRVNTLCTLYYEMTRRHFIPAVTPKTVEKIEASEVLSDCIAEATDKIRVYGLEAERQSSPDVKNIFEQASREMNARAHGLSHIMLRRLNDGAQTAFVQTANDRCDKTAAYNQMRSAWEQHVWWTRSLIVSIANSLGDQKAVTARLLMNPADIASIFYKFYGQMMGDAVKNLIAVHLDIGGQIIQAAKDGRSGDVKMLEEKWYRNADDIVSTLVSINPYYSKAMLTEMFYRHLAMTTDEVTQYLSGDYAASIKTFDAIEREALEMGDYLVGGVLKKFCGK